MRVVVALGGNAILRRGVPMTVANQRSSIAAACAALAKVADENELVVTHGNGPQVGLLALQAAAYDTVSEYPFDVLGAQTEGMIGYLIEQELGNCLGEERPIATFMTRTVVDASDPAFDSPSKFVGPVYDPSLATALSATHGWTIHADGDHVRRVVPSPRPIRIMELRPITWMLEKGSVVICAGGGGIPVVVDPDSGRASGVEAVIDKDLASSILAHDLSADLLVIASDVPGVFEDWGKATQRVIESANPDSLSPSDFPAGSMGPKVDAAIQFARGGGISVIGSLDDIDGLLTGASGTRISKDCVGLLHR
ncbi:carbamate kinase [soil metagenome]